MVYFDNSATTIPYPEVIDTFSTVARSYFANPSSLHPLGKEAEQLLNHARKKVASILAVEAKEIFFTSGGTEGNNLAIKGTARQLQKRGKHIITTSLEHSSTHDAMAELENDGFSITYLTPDMNGQVSAEQIENAITSETILVSMIHVSNELGSKQPVEETGAILRKYPKIVFHVDHVQGITKVPLSIKDASIDLCTISAHKFHGLKGNGVLYVRQGLKLSPLFSGGQQEKGFRPGTENLAGIVSLTKALRMAFDKADDKIASLKDLSTWIEREVSEIDGVVMNSPLNRAPHILNFSILHMKPEVIVQALAERDIYVSTKSACSSKNFEPSRVLSSLGFSETRASSAIRVSLSFDNTKDEAIYFVKTLKDIVSTMKKVVKV
ncbi:cysteine desulfurase NifS [Salipaludibacillus keqinensis]|uniref:Cysteine desulfurase NifS n=1 Tax=Salipaludibacillus keqinensis TaxID=2045207 RepID=A0A323TFZ7_9BACI|nr:cysteine desulfurase family protein [Salipaludibacillus keqinensis]PYZ93768.1 cysteine desulfurase NifS [Salipaludibacillus keqinensis]